MPRPVTVKPVDFGLLGPSQMEDCCALEWEKLVERPMNPRSRFDTSPWMTIDIRVVKVSITLIGRGAYISWFRGFSGSRVWPETAPAKTVMHPLLQLLLRTNNGRNTSVVTKAVLLPTCRYTCHLPVFGCTAAASYPLRAAY